MRAPAGGTWRCSRPGARPARSWRFAAFAGIHGPNERPDAGAAWYRGSGPAPQHAAGSHVRGRIHLALAMLAREPQAVMVGVSLVRGLGFGLCGVVTGALTAQLLPPGRRGEGLGLLGVVSGVPAIVALPAGVWLAGHHLAAAAAALAATAGLLPLVAIGWLPGGREA